MRFGMTSQDNPQVLYQVFRICMSSFMPSDAPFWIWWTREPAAMGLGSMR